MNINYGNCLDVHVIDLLHLIFSHKKLARPNFLCHFFVIVLTLVCAIVRVMLSTTFEETKVWGAIITNNVTFRKRYKPQFTDEGTEYGGFSKNFCKVKDIELYAKWAKQKLSF